MTNEQLSGQSGFALAIVSIIVFDWAMLLFGLSIELKEDNTKDWPCLRFLRYFRRNRIHNVAIALGFLALLLAFWPHFVWAADGYGSDWGWVAIFVTLAIWAVYGVVAWWLYDDDEAQRCPATSNERARNARMSSTSSPRTWPASSSPMWRCSGTAKPSCAPVARSESITWAGAVAWSDKRHGPRRPPARARLPGRRVSAPRARARRALVRRRHCRADRRARAARLHDLAPCSSAGSAAPP